MRNSVTDARLVQLNEGEKIFKFRVCVNHINHYNFFFNYFSDVRVMLRMYDQQQRFLKVKRVKFEMIEHFVSQFFD
jgi:hypothetical protein